MDKCGTALGHPPTNKLNCNILCCMIDNNIIIIIIIILVFICLGTKESKPLGEESVRLVLLFWILFWFVFTTGTEGDGPV